jgi:hypothetical protein
MKKAAKIEVDGGIAVIPTANLPLTKINVLQGWGNVCSKCNLCLM